MINMLNGIDVDRKKLDQKYNMNNREILCIKATSS